MARSGEPSWTLVPSRAEALFVIALGLGFILTTILIVGDPEDSFVTPPGFIILIGEAYRAVIPEEIISPLIVNTLILVIASAFFGFLEPRHPWRWGVASAFLGPMICYLWWAIYHQFANELSTGSDLVLVLGGALQVGFFAVAPIAAGYVGARIRIRQDRPGKRDDYHPGRYRKRRY
jgi:hypothetical protein